MWPPGRKIYFGSAVLHVSQHKDNSDDKIGIVSARIRMLSTPIIQLKHRWSVFIASRTLSGVCECDETKHFIMF